MCRIEFNRQCVRPNSAPGRCESLCHVLLIFMSRRRISRCREQQRLVFSVSVSSSSFAMPPKEGSQWTREDTRVFIHIHSGNEKSSKNSTLWQETARYMSKWRRRSPSMKLKNLKRSYREIRDHNKSGRAPKTVPFFREFDEILSHHSWSGEGGDMSDDTS